MTQLPGNMVDDVLPPNAPSSRRVGRVSHHRKLVEVGVALGQLSDGRIECLLEDLRFIHLLGRASLQQFVDLFLTEAELSGIATLPNAEFGKRWRFSLRLSGLQTGLRLVDVISSYVAIRLNWRRAQCRYFLSSPI